MRNSRHPLIYIVVGKRGSNKTRFLQSLSALLQSKGLRVCGILAPVNDRGKPTESYELLDLETGKCIPFIESSQQPGWMLFRRFWFNPEGFDKGNSIFNKCAGNQDVIAVIDEIGHLELDDQGWADALRLLQANPPAVLILSIRDTFLVDVIDKFHLKDPVIWKSEIADPQACSNQLHESIAKINPENLFC